MTVHRDNDEERNERVAAILKKLQKETAKATAAAKKPRKNK
jgi:hypothetical protein